MKSILKKTGPILAAIVLLLSACASREVSDAPGAPATTTAVEGPEPITTVPRSVPDDGAIGTEPNGEWILVSGAPIVDGFPISLSISNDQFGGRAACNSYGGTLSVGDDVWALTGMAMTEMGCEAPIQDSEQTYIAALQQVDGWTVENGLLILSGPPEPLVFERAPALPTEALVGTEWVLESVVDGDTVSTPVGDPASLLLLDDGTIVGSTGCRTLTGTWVEADAQIFFPTFSTDGECPTDLAAQDSIVVTVLGDGFRAAIDGDVLTLSSMGGLGLVYRAP